MTDYLYMNGGIPFTFNSEDIPSLDNNPIGAHLIKIATAFEDAGIDGVRVEWIKGDGDRYILMLHLVPDSLGKRLLDKMAENGERTNHYPTVEAALVIAKHVQEYEASL